MADKLQVENPANAQMHYGNNNLIGVLVPPDRIQSTTLYSFKEGRELFNTLNKDIYQSQKHATAKKRGTPLGVKILLGIGAAILSFKFIKKLFR